MLDNTVALLDVDETLIITRRDNDSYINEDIIQQLNQAGITKVYLFTSMDSAKIRADAMNAEAGVKIISREEVIAALEAHKLAVLGVITSADPVYNQGLGAMYEDFYKSFMALSYQEMDKKRQESKGYYAEMTKVEVDQETIDRHFRDNGLINTGEIAFQHWMKFLPDDLTPEELDGFNKGSMYAYFLQQKPEWIKNVIFFDDKSECLNTALLINRKNHFPVNLKTIEANIDGSPLDIDKGNIKAAFQNILITIPKRYFRYRIYKQQEDYSALNMRMLAKFGRAVLQARSMKTPLSHPEDFPMIYSTKDIEGIRALDRMTQCFGGNYPQEREKLSDKGFSVDSFERQDFILRLLMPYSDEDEPIIERILNDEDLEKQDLNGRNGGLIASMQAIFIAMQIELGLIDDEIEMACAYELKIKHDEKKDKTKLCINFRFENNTNAAVVFKVNEDYHIRMTECQVSIPSASLTLEEIIQLNAVIKSSTGLKSAKKEDASVCSFSIENIGRLDRLAYWKKLNSTIFELKKPGNKFSRHKANVTTIFVSVGVAGGAVAGTILTGGALPALVAGATGIALSGTGGAVAKNTYIHRRDKKDKWLEPQTFFYFDNNHEPLELPLDLEEINSPPEIEVIKYFLQCEDKIPRTQEGVYRVETRILKRVAEAILILNENVLMRLNYDPKDADVFLQAVVEYISPHFNQDELAQVNHEFIYASSTAINNIDGVNDRAHFCLQIFNIALEHIRNERAIRNDLSMNSL